MPRYIDLPATFQVETTGVLIMLQSCAVLSQRVTYTRDMQLLSVQNACLKQSPCDLRSGWLHSLHVGLLQ